MINSLPTSKIFGEKVDAWWYQKNGFDVEFWDISPFFWSQEELETYYGGTKDYRYIGPNHQVFRCKKDVVRALTGIPNGTVVWDLVWGFNRIISEERWVRDLIIELQLPFFIQVFETPPVGGCASHFMSWLRRKAARVDFYGQQPIGVIGCGKVGRVYSEQVFPDSAFISVPSPKVFWGELGTPATAPYAVFVDENIEYAPDAKMLGFSVSNDLDGYFRRMNRVFEEVEDILGCPVIIAASGKYHYTEDRFAGRNLFYGQSFALIQHASFVIGHCSGALDQAIVSNKPILQIDDHSFHKEQRENIDFSVQFTGNRPIQSDDLNGIRMYLKTPVLNAEKSAEVEVKYFRELDVRGDYREIIKDAFLSV